MAKEKFLTRGHVQNKTFNFAKGNVKLDFTLRVDIKQELKDFQECLEAALSDVKKEIETISAK